MTIEIVNDPELLAENSITFDIDTMNTPMLKISPDGFYVRGVKVPVDDKEALTVFNTLKRFLVEAELRRPY
jgi:hypothetical protein